MLLTEEEAKTKWCPNSRFSVADGEHGVNRWWSAKTDDGPYSVNPEACRCIASRCAAWRWGEFIGPYGYTASRECTLAPTPTRGYCGAFGKPDVA